MVCILVQAIHQPLVSNLGAETVVIEESNHDWQAYSCDNPSGEFPRHSLAYILYTSGSTGKPKGVMVERHSVVNNILWMQETFNVVPTDRVMQKTPYSFDVSVWELFWPILFGASLVIAKPGGHRDTGYLVDLIDRQKINSIHFVPSVLDIFLQHPQVRRCTTIQHVYCIGEALPYSLQEKFHQIVDANLHNLYGPTETTVGVSWWPCLRSSESKVVPIGKPCANTQMYILDSTLNLVSPGVEGELYIGGVQVARGYVNRPELTAERFIRDPFSEVPESRLYKTGDICRWLEDGNIEYLGRVDDQVKIRGYRIELGEIESVLCGHPSVRQAVVMAREDEPGQKYLAGYVVLEGKRDVDGDGLRKYLGQKLPEYMVPSVILQIQSIPLTTSGKTDRKSLPDPNQQGRIIRKGTLPQTGTEKRLATIWGEVLNIDAVFCEDDFFRLGGNSLKAIQVAYRIHNHLGIQIPVSILFEKPVLQDISKTIDIHFSSFVNEGLKICAFRSTEMIPQSSAQKRLWLTQQITGPISYYNVAFMIIIKGDLQIAILERCLRVMIQRHASLRTTFHCVDEKLIQEVGEYKPWTLPVIELPVSDEHEVMSQFVRYSEEQIQKVFNLEKGPLFDFQLIRAASDQFALLLNVHHLITDGWSMGLLIREVGALYSHIESEKNIELAPLAIQYADFAQWQIQHLDTIDHKDLDYWLAKLRGISDGITLPTDFPRPPTQTFKCKWELRKVESWLYSQYLDFCSNHNITLYMLLLAAFKTLLYRYTLQEDILLGSPISGRTNKDIEHVVGFFVNTIILRTTVKKDMSFGELLEKTKANCLEAQQHQDLPYDRLIEKLNPQRLRDRNTLFQVMFAHQDARYWKTDWARLSTRTVEICSGTSIFDFTLFVEENEEGLLLRGEYNADLYKPSTIQRVLFDLEHVLSYAISDPSKPISEMDVSREKDSCRINDLMNATRVPYPTQCIHQLLEEQAVKTPDAVAAEFEGQTLTYSQLNARANRLAHYLREQGVRADTPVGICMDRSLEMMVGLVAILKAGGGYVPLDPLYPADRLRFMAQDIGVKLILADAGLQAIFPDSVERIDPADARIFESYPTANPPCDGTSEDLAYIVFTSGSTGTPKGVAVPHRGVVRLLFGTDYMEFGPELAMLQLAPVSFDASTLEIWGPLLHGGRCVLYPGRMPELDRLQQVLQSGRVNALWLTASLFNLVIDTRPQLLATVGTVLTGGEALSVPHIRKALEALPNVQLVNGYGPTESTTFTCCHRIPKTLPERLTSIPIGRPIGNTQVYILDPRLQLVPIGVAGELYIGGDGLARGYVNRPELTAERFVHNPFSEDLTSRLYKTGDICRWLEDGTIEYRGRADDQVKIRGFRIELGEIESILNSHPQVRQAVVVLREDVPGQKYLAGYAVLEAKGEIDGDGLRKYLGQKLPEYMVPSVIMEIESIPLTANGKVDRKSLPRPIECGAGREEFLPQTETEIKLADIWKQLLKRSTIYREDHFFRLGGHSLLAAELFFRIQDSFAIHLPIHLIFRAPTLGQLAVAVDTATLEMTTRDMVQIKSGGESHPIFYLPGIGGHTLSFYHLAEAMRIDCPQYGLNLRGLDGQAQPQERIEEMASYFIGLVRTVQPHGPYNLCGFSFGGRVAFEMALQFQACGETIGFLGLIGATAPGYPPMPENRWIRTAYRLCDFWKIGPTKQWRYLRFKIRERILRMRRSWQGRRRGNGNHIRIIVSRQKPVVDAAMKAWYHYQPTRRFVGEVTVFRESRAFSDLYARYDDLEYGWGKYVEGAVHSHLMDCGHLDLFRPPHVKILGERLEKCLRQTLKNE
jgi:amino acid adenylation domain-containing protein